MKCIIFPMGYIVLNIICNRVQFINVRITKIGKIHLIRMVLSKKHWDATINGHHITVWMGRRNHCLRRNHCVSTTGGRTSAKS